MFQIEFNDIEDCAIIKISRRDLIEAIYDLAEKQKKQEKRMRHGRWILNSQYGPECSECGTAMFEIIGVPYTTFKPNYCPDCGAKMDGGENV